jgi:tetratricopeptide (TPR) repeat protein
MTTRLRRLTVILLLLGLLASGAWALVRVFREPGDLVAARQALENRDFATAGEHLEKHLAVYPKDQESRFLAIQTARRRGDGEAALRHLRTFEQQGGPSDAAWLERELLALQLGELGDSARLLKFAQDHPYDPSTPHVLEAVIVGNLDVLAPPLSTHVTRLQTNGLPPGWTQARTAVDLWLERATLRADQMQGLIWRARLRELASDHAAALDDLRTVLRETPDNYEAAFLYAVFVSRESPQDTRQRLESLLMSHPDDPRVLLALGSVLHSLGELETAKKHLDRLLAISPQSVQALSELGTLALDRNRPLEAETLLRRALTLTPRDPELHHSLSRCMRVLGRTEEAKQYQEKYQELMAEKQPPKQPK